MIKYLRLPLAHTNNSLGIQCNFCFFQNVLVHLNCCFCKNNQVDVVHIRIIDPIACPSDMHIFTMKQLINNLMVEIQYQSSIH